VLQAVQLCAERKPAQCLHRPASSGCSGAGSCRTVLLLKLLPLFMT